MSKTNREEKVKQLRILQIDQTIREEKYLNATQLAKKFEVSRSTIMRDLEFLRKEYHAPLEYDAEKNGYYYRDKSYFIKGVMLSEGELFSVAAILPLLEQYKNTPMEASFQNILEKLAAMLPEEVSIDSSLLNREFTIFGGNPVPEIDAEIFAKIFQAVKTRCTVTFNYRSISRKEYKEHVFNPYHVICRGGDWYVLGFCHNHFEVRVYSLARMKDLQITDITFEVNEDFDPKSYRDLTFGLITSREQPVLMRFYFDAAVSTYILERKWHETQQVVQNEDGSVELSFVSNQFDEITRWILRFGSSAKVLEPKNLVDKIKTEAEKIAGMYR